MEKDKTIHSWYCEKLREIGERLRFKTSWDSLEEKELYHLANPDCIWYLELPAELTTISDLPEKIPLIAFELLYSEKEKNMRGSFGSFLLRGAYYGVFVLLKPEDQSQEEFLKRDKYLRKMINNLGSKHLKVWYAETADSLANKFGIN